jgi:hypothetical protein
MERRLLMVSVSFLFLFLATPVSALVKGPPGIFTSVDPEVQDIVAGGSAEYSVGIYPQGEWTSGTISVEAEDVPDGVSVEFSEYELTLGEEGTSIEMIVSVSDGTKEGGLSFKVAASGTERYSNAQVFTSEEVGINVVSAPEQVSNTTMTGRTETITVTSTETVMTTLSTATTTEVTTATVTEVLTTRTVLLSTKTYAEPTQQADASLPIITFSAVAGLLVVAAVALRK